jgi:hypothetical protein
MSRSLLALENLACSSVSMGKAGEFSGALCSPEYFSSVKYGRQIQVTVRRLLEAPSGGSIWWMQAGSM